MCIGSCVLGHFAVVNWFGSCVLEHFAVVIFVGSCVLEHFAVAVEAFAGKSAIVTADDEFADDDGEVCFAEFVVFVAAVVDAGAAIVDSIVIAVVAVAIVAVVIVVVVAET